MSDEQGGYLVSFKSAEMQTLLNDAQKRYAAADQMWNGITKLIDACSGDGELLTHCRGMYPMVTLIVAQTHALLDEARATYDAAPTDREATDRFFKEMTKDAHKS